MSHIVLFTSFWVSTRHSLSLSLSPLKKIKSFAWTKIPTENSSIEIHSKTIFGKKKKKKKDKKNLIRTTPKFGFKQSFQLLGWLRALHDLVSLILLRWWQWFLQRYCLNMITFEHYINVWYICLVYMYHGRVRIPIHNVELYVAVLEAKGYLRRKDYKFLFCLVWLEWFWRIFIQIPMKWEGKYAVWVIWEDMELRRAGYAVIFMSLLCKLAIGGSDAKRRTMDTFFSNGDSSKTHEQDEMVWKLMH